MYFSVRCDNEISTKMQRYTIRLNLQHAQYGQASPQKEEKHDKKKKKKTNPKQSESRAERKTHIIIKTKNLKHKSGGGSHGSRELILLGATSSCPRL